MTKIKDIRVGDVFSEDSHYVVDTINKDSIIFKHLESNNLVTLDNKYVTDLLRTSDQYDKEVVVGKEDSKDGKTLGIRSIFENIGSSEVFTVVFIKQGKNKTKKAYQEELDLQIQQGEEIIEKARKSKKSMANAYKEALKFIQTNPVLDYIEGEERILRGYKKQLVSRDGKYECVDVDLKMEGKSLFTRPVNINTITTLVVGGVKYVVK